MPALIVATQALGEPRYPSLKGIMAARSKTVETKTARRRARLGDGAGRRRGRDDGGRSDRRRRRRGPRPGSIREPADEAARQVVDFLAERRII